MGVVVRRYKVYTSLQPHNRFPHTTYPYSSCICSFLQQHPYFLFIFLNVFRSCINYITSNVVEIHVYLNMSAMLCIIIILKHVLFKFVLCRKSFKAENLNYLYSISRAKTLWIANLRKASIDISKLCVFFNYTNPSVYRIKQIPIMVEIHLCNALALALALAKITWASECYIAINTRVAQMYFYRYQLSNKAIVWHDFIHREWEEASFPSCQISPP